jgi:hypothetical protein
MLIAHSFRAGSAIFCAGVRGFWAADFVITVRPSTFIGDENAALAPQTGTSAMQNRHRFKQTLSLQDRLAAWAEEIRQHATQIPPGPDQETLLKKARQADRAIHMDDWLNRPLSAVLRP